jgi:hypothetical protein
MASETALELDTEAAGYTRGDPVHFADFPGVWEPGRPIAVSALGFASGDDAIARAKDLNLPLREVTVDVGSAPMPPRPNHLFSEEQQRAIDLEAASSWPPRTHADADQAAASAGVEWPRQKMTVAEKVEFLEAARTGEATTDDETVFEPVEDGGA